MTKQELQAFVDNRIAQNEDHHHGLDELVHEVYAGMASDKNNEGPESQVDFLVEQWGIDEAARLIQQAMEE